MDYIKPRKDLIFFINPLLYLIGILLFFFFAAYFHFLVFIFWIATFCALIFILTPLGNQRLSSADTRDSPLSWQRWLCGIFLLELSMIGTYFGIALLSGNSLPINTSPHPILFSASLSYVLLQGGLFPWTLYALIAVGMGITAYREKTDAYFSNLLNPHSKPGAKDAVSLITNIGTRRATLVAISITLLFFCLLLASFAFSKHIHLITGFQFPALITTLVFISFAFADITKKISYQFFSRQLPTFITLPIFCIVCAAVMLVSNLLAQTHIEKKMVTPSLIQHWINYPWQSAWFVFSVMWWIYFTPLVAGFITRLSRGYRIRDVILGVCMLPFLIALYMILQHQNNLLMFTPPLFTCKIISLISFLIFLPMLVNHRYASQMVLSYYPKEGIIRHRDYLPFMFRVVQFTLFSFFIYFAIGVNGISLLIFIGNYFTAISFFIVCVAILCRKHFR